MHIIVKIPICVPFLKHFLRYFEGLYMRNARSSTCNGGHSTYQDQTGIDDSNGELLKGAYHISHCVYPIWVPKTHSPKKFNLVFKKTQTVQVILKTEGKLFSAINTICLLVFKTGILKVVLKTKDKFPSVFNTICLLVFKTGLLVSRLVIKKTGRFEKQRKNCQCI